MRTLYNDTLEVQALQSAARVNGTVNGPTVDLNVFANNFRSCLFVISADTVTDGSHAFTAQESPDGTAWTTVTPDRILGTPPTLVAASTNSLASFGVITQGQRYLRLVATTSGATTGGVFSAKAVLANGSISPVRRS